MLRRVISAAALPSVIGYRLSFIAQRSVNCAITQTKVSSTAKRDGTFSRAAKGLNSNWHVKLTVKMELLLSALHCYANYN